MPLGERHRSQKRKNIVMLLVLLGLMALLFAITMMKMSGGVGIRD